MMKVQTEQLEGIYKRIAETGRQLQRKISLLEKEAGFTEFLDESFRTDTVRLEATLQESLAEISSLEESVHESMTNLRNVSEKDQSNYIASLETELDNVNNVSEKTKVLVELSELIEATESCTDDPDTALRYLETIEKDHKLLDEWSNGNLSILKTVENYLLNKRYTFESDKRKELLKVEEHNQIKLFTDREEDEIDSSDFLGKLFPLQIRDILKKPLEPTETVDTKNFGGIGDVQSCEVSFWLRPLVVELLESSSLSFALDMYKSLYDQLIPSFSLRSIMIFYCNSMFIAHRIFLETLSNKLSRVAVDEAMRLRHFAENHLMRKLQEIKFHSEAYTLEDCSHFREYKKKLRKAANDLREILPANVSQRIVKLLVNHFLKTIVNIVLNSEDIESKEADQWTALLTDVISLIEEIGSDITIESLPRLKELRNILTYGLKEIAANWKNRDSQLRNCFSAAEIRHLVKAIFQNSEMRKSVLSQLN